MYYEVTSFFIHSRGYCVTAKQIDRQPTLNIILCGLQQGDMVKHLDYRESIIDFVHHRGIIYT